MIKVRIGKQTATFKGQEWESADKGLEWFLNQNCGAYTIGYSPDWDASAKELIEKHFVDYEILEESTPPKKKKSQKPEKPDGQETIY